MTTREAGPFAKIMKRGSVALLVVTLSLPSLTAPAVAQEYRERRTLLEMLFGGPNQQNDRLYAPERREQRRQAAPPRQNSTRSVTRPSAPRSTRERCSARASGSLSSTLGAGSSNTWMPLAPIVTRGCDSTASMRRLGPGRATP